MLSLPAILSWIPAFLSAVHIFLSPPNWNKLKRDDDPKKYFLPTRVSLSAFPFPKNYRKKCLIRTKTEGRCEGEEEDDKEKSDKWIKFENKNHERHSRCASSAKLKRICISFCLIRLEVPHHSIFFSPSLRYQRWIRCRLGRVFSGTSEHMKLFWTLLSRFGPVFGTAFQFDLRNTTSSRSGEPFSSWQRFGGVRDDAWMKFYLLSWFQLILIQRTRRLELLLKNSPPSSQVVRIEKVPFRWQ